MRLMYRIVREMTIDLKKRCVRCVLSFCAMRFWLLFDVALLVVLEQCTTPTDSGYSGRVQL